MNFYRIANWSDHYEVADSRKVDGPLKWLPVKTATDGLVFSRITLEPDRCELLAAWHLMLGVAAKQPKACRGDLARDGVPMTPDDLAAMTRFPAPIFARAMEFFSSPRMGWLTVEDYAGPVQGVFALSAPDASGQTPAPSGRAPATGQDRTGQDTTIGRAAPIPDADFEAVWQAYPKKKGKQDAKPQIAAAIKRHGLDKILTAVNAYAAAVATWPVEDRQYVPDPVRWFKRGQYEDDPATWQRGNSKPQPSVRYV